MTAEPGIITVTGSNGSIGTAVMRRFAGRFTDVVGFDRKAPKAAPPGCVNISVDITSDESVREGLRTIRDHHGTQVASVIHLAAYYDFFGAPSSQYDEITVRGTGRLLRGVSEDGFQVEQFVFSSTMLTNRPGEAGQRLELRPRRLGIHQGHRPRQTSGQPDGDGNGVHQGTAGSSPVSASRNS